MPTQDTSDTREEHSEHVQSGCFPRQNKSIEKSEKQAVVPENTTGAWLHHKPNPTPSMLPDEPNHRLKLRLNNLASMLNTFYAGLYLQMKAEHQKNVFVWLYNWVLTSRTMQKVGQITC